MLFRSGVDVVSVNAFEVAEWNAAQAEPLPGLVSHRWIEDQRRVHGEESAFWQARVLGQVPDEAADALIRLGWIEAARRRWEDSAHECEIHECGWTEREAQAVQIGLDVARHGGDKIAWAIRQDVDVVHVETWDGTDDLTKVIDHTAALCAQWSAKRVVVDATGMGWGVVDGLTRKQIDVLGVNFGAKATDERRFANRRAELWWTLREWLRLGRGALPLDDSLLRDLLAPTYKFGKTGERFELEGKDEMRKRLGRSPDLGDAVALCLVGYESASARPFEVTGRPAWRHEAVRRGDKYAGMA